MPVANHQIYFQRDQRVPMTYITLVFNGAGSQQETEEKAGLARFTAKMLFRGTRTLTREAIARKLEMLGAEASAHVSETDFVISISTFTRNVEAVLDLVSTIMNDATFPADELELLRKSALNQLDAALQDPERILSAAHLYVQYGGMRFGKIGSRKGIINISRDDVMSYFSNATGSSVLYFSSISDLSKNDVERHLDRFRRERRAGGFVLQPEMNFKETHGREAHIVESKDATNDRFHWSQRGLEATDDRRFDLSLIIDALGSFEGFLFDELRNKNGWCYGCYAFVTPGTTRRGRLGFYADPSRETSALLIPELLRLLEQFPSEEGFRNRLRERTSTFKNRYPYQLDPRYKLASEVNRDRYGIPILDRAEYNARIDAITAGTVEKVIAEVFDLRNLSMVFYGDSERIRRILHGIDASIALNTMQKEALVE